MITCTKDEIWDTLSDLSLLNHNHGLRSLLRLLRGFSFRGTLVTILQDIQHGA
ncbi:hypothetical protein GIB67_035098 [Kingdonia uniflora]|uniref:Uncharacterized protein n=1 Tax=Kingdonia uniflora TaxID=39325 RepID=A0A7J7MCR4_9MAGN|nr:hypothetical protein GIB67_035098 [Kingdonia uniflora]